MNNNFTPTVIKYFDGETKIYEDLTKIDYYTIKNQTLVSGVKIGNSVNEIMQGAFFDCSNAKYITIPDSVVILGKRCFAACEEIRSIELPIHIKTIGEEAFSYCKKLNTIVLSDGLGTISEGMFSYCRNLESLTIPKSVTHIENYAFFSCLSLAKIICLSETSPILLGNYIFFNFPENGTLYYPKGSDYSIWKCRLPKGWELIEI